MKIKKVLKIIGGTLLFLLFVVSCFFMMAFVMPNTKDTLGGGMGIDLEGLTGDFARWQVISFFCLLFAIITMVLSKMSRIERLYKETKQEEKVRYKTNKRLNKRFNSSFWIFIISFIALFVISLLDFLLCAQDWIHLMHPLFYFSTAMIISTGMLNKTETKKATEMRFT